MVSNILWSQKNKQSLEEKILECQFVPRRQEAYLGDGKLPCQGSTWGASLCSWRGMHLHSIFRIPLYPCPEEWDLCSLSEMFTQSDKFGLLQVEWSSREKQKEQERCRQHRWPQPCRKAHGWTKPLSGKRKASKSLEILVFSLKKNLESRCSGINISIFKTFFIELYFTCHTIHLLYL